MNVCCSRDGCVHLDSVRWKHLISVLGVVSILFSDFDIISKWGYWISLPLAVWTRSHVPHWERLPSDTSHRWEQIHVLKVCASGKLCAAIMMPAALCGKSEQLACSSDAWIQPTTELLCVLPSLSSSYSSALLWSTWARGCCSRGELYTELWIYHFYINIQLYPERTPCKPALLVLVSCLRCTLTILHSCTERET